MEVDPDFAPDGSDEVWLGWNDRGCCGVNIDRELDEADDEQECEDEGAQCDTRA